MAEGAWVPHRRYPACVIELAGHPDQGIGLEQGESACRIAETDPARLELRFQLVGQSICVHLEADRQGGLRAYSGANPAVFRARDRLVQLQGIAKKCFGAESVETEDAPALFQHA